MVKNIILVGLTLGGIWALAVFVLSLDRIAPAPKQMPAAAPVYESREQLARLTYPRDCDATVIQGGKSRCYFRKEKP